MKRFFYLRMALTNLKNHRKTFIPYILASMFTISMFYILHSISNNDDLLLLKGGDALQMILSFGLGVVVVFACIFIFYINSFLIKRRKKEIGLYNILGMEKKHIMGMLFYETIYTITLSLGLGILFGAVFSKLMFLLLLNLAGFNANIHFYISLSSIVTTAIVFIPLFLVTLFFNVFQIHTTNPVNLLKGGNTGEKEPKTKKLLTLFGIGCLASGYYLAQTIIHPIEALMMFFVAVILVILGTYALFVSGSISILKVLRRKKSFYYKTKHFTVISGMLYRMKQNAVGLASICILSTCIIVMVSTTISLYAGAKDMLQQQYPHDITGSNSISIDEDIKEKREQLYTTINDLKKEYSIETTKITDYCYAYALFSRNEGSFSLASDAYNTNISSISFMTLAEYNALLNTNLTLDEGQIFISSNNDTADDIKNIKIDDYTFTKKATIPAEPFTNSNDLLLESYLVIVPNNEILDSMLMKFKSIDNSGRKYEYTHVFAFDIPKNQENKDAFAQKLISTLNADETNAYHTSYKKEMSESFSNLFGGFLFIGIFLGLQFIIATTLIIYYKQISEGYDDKDRYEIMQKVGMSKQEIKQSIHFQILLVFFLPLLVAIIHYIFAFNMITKLLALFQLTNTNLFMICSGITMVIFAIFYSIVFVFTSNAYYKIVK